MENYSIMDLVTIGGILTTAGAIIGIFIKNFRDTKAIMREFSVLLDKQKDLSKDLSKESHGLSKEHSGLSKEHENIKEDTKYIRDEMLAEKMARKELYHNVSNAKEILSKMDFMKEVVLQNNELSLQNKHLMNEVVVLKDRNEKLSNIQPSDDLLKLMRVLVRFESQLATFEAYEEADDIRILLKKMRNELSEYMD